MFPECMFPNLTSTEDIINCFFLKIHVETSDVQIMKIY